LIPILENPVHPAYSQMMSKFKYQHGRLSFLSKPAGHELGREDWCLTRNRDGTTTMRSLLMTDDSKVVRDAMLTRTKDGRPTDGFVRLMVERQFIGSGYFRVEADKLHVVTDGPETGHCQQTLKIPTDLFAVATHSGMLDGWMIFNYDRAKGGPQVRTVYNTLMPGSDVGGTLGPPGPLGKLETCRISLLGEEEIVVPAGTFKATHFTVDSNAGKSSASHLWVAGEDRVLLRREGGEPGHEYILTLWKTEQR
jgi:hypothetical protein